MTDDGWVSRPSSIVYVDTWVGPPAWGWGVGWGWGYPRPWVYPGYAPPVVVASPDGQVQIEFSLRKHRDADAVPHYRVLFRGAEIVGAEVGQFALKAFDVEAQCRAVAEQQQRAAAGRIARMKLDADQVQGLRRTLEALVEQVTALRAVTLSNSDGPLPRFVPFRAGE